MEILERQPAAGLEALASELQRLQAEVIRLRTSYVQLESEYRRYRESQQTQLGQLQLMFEVAGRVASTLDLDELLPIIMDDAQRVMNAEASSILLMNETTGELEFKVALGEKGEEVKKITVPRGQGIAGWVAEHGQTLLVPDVQKDSRYAKKVADSVGFKVQSILCAPLRDIDLDGKVIGVVQVINWLGPGGPAFREEDVQCFEAFASQSSTAINQARAHQEVVEAHQEVVELFDNTIRVTSATLDARDPYTQGHSQRVTDFALAIAEEIDLPKEEIKDLRLSGLLHDVGKIGVRDDILLKQGKLTDEEFEQMKKHPVIGWEIFRPVKQLRRSLDGIRHHHERMDGRGYPDGLKGEAIPLQGRILAVADCFDAMTSTRSYRKAMPVERAFQLMSECREAQHEGRLLDAMIAAYEKGKVIEQARRPDAPHPPEDAPAAQA